MKQCSECKIEYPATTEFFRSRKRNKCGLGAKCKTCQGEIDRKYNVTNRAEIWERTKQYRKTKRGKLTVQKAALKYLYGLTLEQYDQMFEDQGGVCKTCSKVNVEGEKLCVDHDHKTGKVRGLLCYKCNFLLGRIENNLDIVGRMLDYLLKSE